MALQSAAKEPHLWLVIQLQKLLNYYLHSVYHYIHNKCKRRKQILLLFPIKIGYKIIITIKGKCTFQLS